MLALNLVSRAVKTCRKMSSAVGNDVTLKTVLRVLEDFVPLAVAESWDNVGLQIEPSDYSAVKKILLTNDLTEAVVKEAVMSRANFIITYHPLIFAPLKSITQKDFKSRIIAQCFENKIAVFSPHTSWDASKQGINMWPLEALNVKLSNPQPIIQNPDFCFMGGGRLCKLEKPLAIDYVVERLKKTARLPSIQIALKPGTTLQTQISTIAVCVGSGASVLRKAEAELMITGEMSHHDLLDFTINKGTTVIAMNHSNSERPFLYTFKKYLNKQIDVPVEISEVDADPLQAC